MFKWNVDKNTWLHKVRGITFDEVVQAIGDGYGVADIPHWNTEKYPNQRMFIVNINEYAYLVPFIESQDEIFLKTVIPSRKATKKYIGAK